MSHRVLIVLALLTSLPNLLYAGIYGTIEGKVTDEKGKPVAAATVKVEGTNRGANTKSDGSFKLNKMDAKRYTLVVKMIGFATTEKSVTVSPDQTSYVTIALKPQDKTTGTVVVVGTRPDLVKPDNVGTNREIKGEENVKIARESVQEVVALQAGVQSTGAGFQMRGSRAEGTQVLVDGINTNDQFTGGFGNAGFTSAPTVSSFAVEQVQVLSGAFSAEYGNALGGVVNSVVKTGRNDRYEGLFRYRTDLPGLNGSGKNGLKLAGENQSNFDVNIGGPLPLTDNVTFFLAGRNAYSEFANNGIGVVDPWGINLGQMPDNQQWVRNLTGRLKINFGDVSLTAGGQLGTTARERSSWYWRYANDFAVNNLRLVGNSIVGDTGSITERVAKQAVVNSFNNNALVRIDHVLNVDTYYQLTVSTQVNNSEAMKRSDFGSPGLFSGISVFEPTDELTSENDPNNPFKVVRNTEGNGAVDVFEYVNNTNSRTQDGYVAIDTRQRNELTGFIEGPDDASPTNNPYGLSQYFAQHGNERNLDFRYSSYIRVDGNFNHDFKTGEVAHKFKTGFEANFYTVERHYNSLPWDANGFIDIYSSRFGGNIYAPTGSRLWDLTSQARNPIDGSFFIQDQISYKGVIVSPGLRFDLFDPNSRYRVSTRFTSIVNLETDAFADATTKIQVSPRINIAYPITRRSVVNLAWGIYFQRPVLNYLYDAMNTDILRGNSILGNPNLNPQRTNHYQVAYNLQINDDFAFDLTAYFKDDFNQVGISYVPSTDTPYFLYSVAEYGNAKGLEFTLRRRAVDHIGIDLNYTMAAVNSTSSSAGDNYNRPPDPYTSSPAFPLNEFPASFDRRHVVNAIVNFTWSKNEGPSIGGIYPIENTNINFTGRYRTGLPYTRLSPKGIPIGEFNAERQPDFWGLDMRLTRAFYLADWFGDDMGNTQLEFFVDVINLMNRTAATAVFARSGDPDQDNDGYARPRGDFSATIWYKDADPANASSIGTAQYDINGRRFYSTEADSNRDGKVTQDEKYNSYLGYVRDAQARLLNYQQPRTVFFGFMFRF